MEVIPAIDIRDGRCVQLYQGDYERETVFSDNPVDMAVHWAELGASRIHVVDLDAARSGKPENLPLVRQIASAVRVPVQTGGGIRDLKAARAAVDAGVDRVVIGTAVVEDPDLLASVCADLGVDRVVVSLDARDGYVATRGWTRTSRSPVAEVIAQVRATGVSRIVYTDISRDGTLTEPNFAAIEALFGSDGVSLLVAGGITSIEHLTTLSRMGVEGAIVGTAAYTGDIDMAEAFRTVCAPSSTFPDSGTRD
jgi:phosphoribosylformimino-5-aminoimidazole carboxamide ribotide isomerase